MLETLLSLFAVTINTLPTSTINNKSNVEIISDFSGNKFTLIEDNNSYEIYTSDNVFLEGSSSVYSPYLSASGKKYYLGPGNYFVANDNQVTDIITGTTSPIENYNGLSYTINDTPEAINNEPNRNTSNTYVDTEGFTLVNRTDYFKRLKNFPRNWIGECGLIGLSILLSYYDTFYNDDFIPNDITYNASYEKQTTQTRSGDNSKLENSTIEPLVKTTRTPYKNTSFYSYKDWSDMPGTNYSMRDYLMDKYMHTFFGIKISDEGYPMLDGELKDTLWDYMKANCNHLIADTEFRVGNLFYTHQKPKEYISEGLPTLLVLPQYEYLSEKGKPHIVVAYGYKDNVFLCHMGWWPGTTGRSAIKVSNATIYGYFTIKYNGPHKHSSNVSMSKLETTKYICGCGSVHKSKYSICPSRWGFDARYYFEDEGLKTKVFTFEDLTIKTERLRCGYIENQYVNLSPNRKDAGYAYLDLTFNKVIHQLNTNISFWSSNEDLSTMFNDYAYIKYLDKSGNWQILQNLLRFNLSKNRELPSYFELEIPDGTKRIRFEAYKYSPNTDRNKGRICIGDTEFITKNANEII